MLALLIWVTLTPILKKRPTRTVGTTLLTLILAALDEYHQTLVPGRSGALREVLVDLAGILIALFLLALPLMNQKLQEFLYTKYIWLLGLSLGICLPFLS